MCFDQNFDEFFSSSFFENILLYLSQAFYPFNFFHLVILGHQRVNDFKK